MSAIACSATGRSNQPIIHTALDPDAGNTPRIVTALAHAHGENHDSHKNDLFFRSVGFNSKNTLTLAGDFG